MIGNTIGTPIGPAAQNRVGQAVAAVLRRVAAALQKLRTTDPALSE